MFSRTNIPFVMSQAEVSYHIDQFVDEMLMGDDPAYLILTADQAQPCRLTSLGMGLQYLNQMVALFDGRVDYDYSENLELFIDACHDIRLEHNGYRYTCPDPPVRA